MGIGDLGTDGSCSCLNSNVTMFKHDGDNSIKVAINNGTSTNSAHTGYLSNQNKSFEARLVHLFPKFNKALLSLGQFCNDGIQIYTCDG